MSHLAIRSEEVDLVLFHGGCPDGFTAAYVAWTKLGDKAKYIGIGHGSVEEKRASAGDLNGKHVVVLDFSFEAETTAQQVASAASYAVLDHHKTAEDNLRDLGDQHKTFEMRMSGASLAWDFFNPDVPCPLILRYVEDKDIWRWALHSSKEFSAAFALAIQLPDPGEVTGKDFAPLHELCTGGDDALQGLLTKGSILLSYQQQLVTAHAARAQKRRLKAFPHLVCGVVNSTVLESEIGNAITSSDGVNFALIFQGTLAGFKISLRSNFPGEGQADVSEIAKHFGGGGHQAASGCTFKVSDITEMFEPTDA